MFGKIVLTFDTISLKTYAYMKIRVHICHLPSHLLLTYGGMRFKYIVLSKHPWF